MRLKGTALLQALIFSLLMVLTAPRAHAQELLPPSFNVDSAEIAWDQVEFGLFGGATVERVANPDKSGLNQTDYVLQYRKADVNWGGFFYDISPSFRISAGAVFRMKVWSPRTGIAAMLKLEGDGASNEMLVQITESNTWTTVEWDLNSLLNAEGLGLTVNRIVMGLDHVGAAPDGGADFTWYIDDVQIENVNFVEPTNPNTPATPAGFVVSNMIGENPVADGQLFLAAGPNNVTEEGIEYRLFYSRTSDAPANPLDATQYQFGTTAGDGGGNDAFGFVIGGLNPGREYTFWLYQYDSGESLYSAPAVASAVAGGDAGEVNVPATPAGFVVRDMIGETPVADGQLFLAAGPNDVADEDIEYRLFYAPTSNQPANPRDATQYQFGTTAGDGGGNNAFGFVISGLDPGREYTFWLYQYNRSDGVYSAPAIASAVAGGGDIDDTTRPAAPAGFVVFDSVGGSPLADGELFLAVGPNNVADANIEYRLFYGLSANHPDGPLEGTQYEFGTTAGDGGGVNAFGFVLGGLEPGRDHTFWLYQYNTASNLYSDPAIVTAVSVGTGSEPVRPAAPAGLVIHDTVGGNALADGQLFLAVGPNNVTSADIEYRLFYGLAADEPRGPRGGTQYQFGTTPGDGGGVQAFGFVLGGLEPGKEYRFWLYQYNSATSLYSNPAIATSVAAGQVQEPGLPGQIVNPTDRADLQAFPLVFNIDNVDVDWDDFTFYAFDGGRLRRIENPDESTGNPSDYVLEYTKNAGGQPWAGFFYHLQSPVYATAETVFRLNVWSPRAGIQALMKLETQDDQHSTGDRLIPVTLAEEWNTLEWDLSGINRNVPWSRVVVIMDLDTANPPQGGVRDTWYIDDFELAGVTSTSSEVLELPLAHQLHQNYPNPFNPSTTIQFDLPSASHVTLEVFNVWGQRVEVLAQGSFQSGTHAVSFDASRLPSGTYFYRIQAGSFTKTQKMTLVK